MGVARIFPEVRTIFYKIALTATLPLPLALLPFTITFSCFIHTAYNLLQTFFKFSGLLPFSLNISVGQKITSFSQGTTRLFQVRTCIPRVQPLCTCPQAIEWAIFLKKGTAVFSKTVINGLFSSISSFSRWYSSEAVLWSTVPQVSH